MNPAEGHTISSLAEAIGGKLIGDLPTLRVRQLSIDSRKPVLADGTLFIALKGPHHDGHAHVKAMHEQGIRAFMVNKRDRSLADAVQIEVEDTLASLQKMVTWHRSLFSRPVIGITGSNGKTIVKEWLFQALQSSEHIARSPGSWNSQVGVPLSVWNLNSSHTLGLFEAGISRPGEMEKLAPIIRPTIGIITNIGPAHGENFTDDHAKALEKLKLFDHARALVFCRDQAVVLKAIQELSYDHQMAMLDWSRKGTAFVHVLHERVEAEHTELRLLSGEQEFTLRAPFTDRASVENVMHVVTLLLHLKHTPDRIAQEIAGLRTLPMRMQLLQGVGGSTLLDDTYSNDLSSLRIALERLQAVSGNRPKVVILSDIEQSASSDEELRISIQRALDQAKVDDRIFIGPHMARLFPAAIHYPDREALIAALQEEHFHRKAILVKGARSFGLEQVVARLQEKQHRTVLEIDLSAVRHNLNQYRGLLAPGTRIMAMVKAFGYGSGAPELARLLEFERVHYLGVAYADEGIALRQEGIRTPIMVMDPGQVAWDSLQRFQLEAEVFSLEKLDEGIAFAEDRSDPPAIHLKLDTGMNRLGIEEEEMDRLCELLRKAGRLKVASVFSHLAGSDDMAFDAFTQEQIDRFVDMADRIDAVLGYRPMRHILNSAGTERFPVAHFDMVRIGIGMYGLGGSGALKGELQHALRLTTPITQLRTLHAGESVGYNRAYTAESDRRIATLPIGYADGLPRRLGNGRWHVWIGDHKAPFVGNICMDMSMVDVTDIDCRAGDEVVLFDAQHTADEMAKALGTISYEVLTAISQRVQRVYVQDR